MKPTTPPLSADPMKIVQARGAPQDRDPTLIDLGTRQNPDGSPVRLRTNGRLKRPTGLYFSVKSGRHLPYESRAELHDLWRAEVDPDVIRSWVQPFVLDFMVNGKVRSYTPDRRDHRSDGSYRVVEVKDELRALDHDDLEKLRWTQILMAKRGWTFCVHDRAEIEAEPEFSATRDIQRLRRTRLTLSDLAKIKALLYCAPRELGWIKEALGSGPQCLALLSALIVHRCIRIDLSCGLRPDAMVEWNRS